MLISLIYRYKKDVDKDIAIKNYKNIIILVNNYNFCNDYILNEINFVIVIITISMDLYVLFNMIIWLI